MELFVRLALAKETVQTKKDSLLYLMGTEGRKIYKTLTIEKPEEERTVADILDGFDRYCSSAVNVDMERHKFFQRKQDDDTC